MPSDSIAGFLDHAQAVRVLFPEQIEQLIRQPDIPQSDLSQLCEYLQSRGVLTRFQAEAVREARGSDLNFAGYPILDELGPCPGGISYKALHPSLRTPVVLRRLSAEWLNPSDNGVNFVSRARAFGMIGHPNAVTLLDAGFHRDELYVVFEEPVGADLDDLAREVGGAMPGFLAAEYGRSLASVLRGPRARWRARRRSAGERRGGTAECEDRSGRNAASPARTGCRGSPLRTWARTVAAARVAVPPDHASLPYLPPERRRGKCLRPAGRHLRTRRDTLFSAHGPRTVRGR